MVVVHASMCSTTTHRFTGRICEAKLTRLVLPIIHCSTSCTDNKYSNLDGIDRKGQDVGALGTGYGSKVLVKVIPLIPRMHPSLYKQHIFNYLEIKLFPPCCYFTKKEKLSHLRLPLSTSPLVNMSEKKNALHLLHK